MPFRPQHSLLRVDVPALRSVDTYSAADLFGMWSLFSRTSDAMEEGKRLENLSWRLWNRETFCCDARSTSARSPRASFPSASASRPVATAQGDFSVPSLSSSLDSLSSAGCDDDNTVEGGAPDLSTKARPELRRASPSSDSQHSRATKHITPNHLADIVQSINQTKSLEPLELPALRPLDPASASAPPCQGLADLCLKPVSRASEPATESRPIMSHAAALEASASTVATDDADEASPPVGSDTSSNTEMSTHSIVRGFAPSSYRSQTNLVAQPTPILKTSSSFHPSRPKQKGAKFTIGTSSGEDESSFESHMYKSSLSESLRRKQTSFREDIAASRAAEQHSPVFETDEEDEEVSESAIEDDDDSSDWEDSEDASRPSSVTDRGLFKRVDSRPNLTSHRSLLTTLMHEPDRAKALATAASRSTPALRRSRTATPNAPSTATSPDSGHLMPVDHHRGSAAQPILTTTSHTQTQPVQAALSPRTTRRNMLSTELTDSLRKNLLWERQHRSNGNLTALRRRHTSHDVKNLRQFPEPVMLQPSQTGPLGSGAGARTFNNDYFNHGLQEYHAKGW